MSKVNLNILMLEDSEFDAELNEVQLSVLEEYNCIITLVADKSSYINALTADPKPDLILSDYKLPGYSGKDALEDLNALKLNIPFIFVTGAMQEEVAADAIKAGAWEYVVKDRLFRLPLAVKSVLKLKKEKEIALEAERRTQRLLSGIDKTSMQVVVVDQDFNIDYANYNFLKERNFKTDNVIGVSILKLFSEENEVTKEVIGEILQRKESFKDDVKLFRTDGSEYWLHLTFTPVLDEHNDIKSFILTANDITGQKKLEEDLKKYLDELEVAKAKAEESDNLKTAFLANLSHEIRTPMNGIMGFASLLKSSNLSQRLIVKYSDIIEKSGERMLNLIESLVDISKIEADQIKIELKEVYLSKVIDEVFEFFKPQAQKKDIIFKCIKGAVDYNTQIVVDSQKLNQVLSNLLKNALKFTKAGSIVLKYDIEDNNLKISIKDTGPGIRPEMQEIIFERFRQAENTYLLETEGTGLGLSISKSFVEKMGGEIWLESELGKGSEFFLSIPIEILNKTKKVKTNKKAYEIEEFITVLIAEDDIYSYEIIKEILKNKNIVFLHADNGKQAVELFYEHPEIQIVLVDLKMPVMNGLEATSEIRKINPEIPIIAQTAYISEKDKQNALQAGCSGYISKPIKKERLLDEIEKALHYR
ncbi:MAG: response regulator [Bacteroidales bacterium]|nr:response regulator [Bacteroidales bacterium]